MLSYDSVRTDISIELQSRLFEHRKVMRYHYLPKRTHDISAPGLFRPKSFLFHY